MRETSLRRGPAALEGLGGAPLARGSAPLTLRARQPGYAVVQKCLEVQAAAGPRTAWQRAVGRDPLTAEARSWFKGALGERAVARELAGLGPEYTVLHAVPVGAGRGDIDHVVVGPTGVFCLNTKNHADRRVWVGGGTFMVEGRRTAHVHRSLGEGETATKLLSAAAGVPVLVQPLLVVQAAALRFGDKAPRVVTLRPHEVGRWIAALPRVHSPEAVRYFSMLAEERATWHVEAVVVDDTLRHVQRFERLERDIVEARTRRRLLRRAVTLAGLALPAGAVLGWWWGVAVAMWNGLPTPVG